MNAAALNLPYAPGAQGAGAIRSFALALTVHCVLFAFLYFGVRWQSQPPESIAAELWVPAQMAPAPRIEAPKVEPAPEPKPVPVVKDEPKEISKPAPKPDIAIKEEKKKPEPKKEATPVAPDPIKDALQREELQRKAQQDSLAQAAAREASSASAKSRRDWEAQIAAKVRSRVRLPDNLTGNPEAIFEVTLLPNMEVLNVKLVTPSGVPAYDQAAERAINAASPFPPPPAGVDPGRVLRLPFRPKN